MLLTAGSLSLLPPLLLLLRACPAAAQCFPAALQRHIQQHFLQQLGVGGHRLGGHAAARQNRAVDGARMAQPALQESLLSELLAPGRHVLQAGCQQAGITSNNNAVPMLLSWGHT